MCQLVKKDIEKNIPKPPFGPVTSCMLCGWRQGSRDGDIAVLLLKVK